MRRPFAAVVLASALAACGGDGIQSYRVPKEPARAAAPPARRAKNLNLESPSVERKVT